VISLNEEFCKEGLALADLHTLQIEQSNPLFLAMLGLTKPTADGILLKDAIPGFDHAAMQRAFGKSVPEYIIEAEVRPLKGRPTPLRIAIRKHGSDESCKILIRLSDISELYKYSFLIKSVEELLDANKRRAAEAQQNFKAILDALPQQFLTIDSRGLIGTDHSARVGTIFPLPVAGEDFWKLSGLEEGYREVADLAFSGVEWDTVAQLLPPQFIKNGRLIEVKFVPMYSEGSVSALVVACQDVTDIRSLMETVERQTRQAKVVFAVLSARAEFLELLELADSLETNIEKPEAMSALVHTLKGGFLLFGCQDLAEFCHVTESEWTQHGYDAASGLLYTQNMRQRLDSFLEEYRDFLGITRRDNLRRKELVVDMESIAHLYSDIKALPLESSLKSSLIAHLEQAATVPLWKTLGWLEKIWQETLRDVGKAGARITWDASVATARDPYKRLFQSLLHVVRNAAVHGIETVEERLRQGKPREGALAISCLSTSEGYSISIQDDGRGVDFAAIRRLAINRGLSAAKDMPEEALLELIFSPTLSVKTEADELSGRGIGLAVVRREARALGGDVVVTTHPGRGTTFTISFEHQELFLKR
jgi:signal transduction histidine kinase/PAS domain-containing protein